MVLLEGADAPGSRGVDDRPPPSIDQFLVDRSISAPASPECPNCSPGVRYARMSPPDVRCTHRPKGQRRRGASPLRPPRQQGAADDRRPRLFISRFSSPFAAPADLALASSARITGGPGVLFGPPGQVRSLKPPLEMSRHGSANSRAGQRDGPAAAAAVATEPASRRGAVEWQPSSPAPHGDPRIEPKALCEATAPAEAAPPCPETERVSSSRPPHELEQRFMENWTASRRWSSCGVTFVASTRRRLEPFYRFLLTLAAVACSSARRSFSDARTMARLRQLAAQRRGRDRAVRLRRGGRLPTGPQWIFVPLPRLRCCWPASGEPVLRLRRRYQLFASLHILLSLLRWPRAGEHDLTRHASAVACSASA